MNQFPVRGEAVGTRADKIYNRQGFVRALNSQARLRGFEITDTVRKLYGVA